MSPATPDPTLVAAVQREFRAAPKSCRWCNAREGHMACEFILDYPALATLVASWLEPMEEYARGIEALSDGWDENGSLGPRPPLSWETVARMAMDYARAALAALPGREEEETS